MKIRVRNYTHKAMMLVKEPNLWNPEQLYYTLPFRKQKGEVITDRIGLREIVVKDKQFFGTEWNRHQIQRCGTDTIPTR